MPGRDIIVIGASLGGPRALAALCKSLPSDLAAAVFVVWHTLPVMSGQLPYVLSGTGPLPAEFAVDGEVIKPGRIYIAPPDQHLLLTPRVIQLSSGPRENRFRPAIDPLFRSAARSFGPRVTGVVLTGLLDDGTQGLWFIKKHGGTTIVQDPVEAEAPSMPTSAIEAGVAQHVLPVLEMGPVIARLTREPVSMAPSKEGVPMSRDEPRAIGDLHPPEVSKPPAPLACPECHGTLWINENEGVTRYECHVGHQFSEQGLPAAKQEEVELALWTALRVLKENAALHGSVANRARAEDRLDTAARFEVSRDEYLRKAALIRRAMDLPDNNGWRQEPRVLREEMKTP